MRPLSYRPACPAGSSAALYPSKEKRGKELGYVHPEKIPQNFAYVAIKELALGYDIDALKIASIERSVVLFQELKSRGVL